MNCTEYNIKASSSVDIRAKNIFFLGACINLKPLFYVMKGIPSLGGFDF